MRKPAIPANPLQPPAHHFRLVLFALTFLAAGTCVAYAQDVTTLPPAKVSAWRIFVMLFLMLGPTKILVPFVTLTHGLDDQFRGRLARRAMIFSLLALAIAGLLGRGMLENLNISLPVLMLAAGLVLFLVALQTVLHPANPTPQSVAEPEARLKLAISPLAFPTIVTPYGIAAVIIFATIAQDTAARLTLAAVVLLVLALDWVAMIYANAILRWFGTALQIFSVVLGVTQIALGLQLIIRSLTIMGIFAEGSG